MGPDFVIGLVHGTWAPDAEWMRGDSEFCRALGNLLGGNVVFWRSHWSGSNSLNARLDAAFELRQQIAGWSKQFPTARHVVIGHSHGGSIVSYALSDPAVRAMILGGISLSTPFVTLAPRNLPTTPRALATFLTVVVAFTGIYLMFTRIGMNLASLGLCLIVTAVTFILLSRMLSNWQKRARNLLETIGSLSYDSSDLLVIRAPGDEAAGALGTAHLIGWVGTRLLSRLTIFEQNVFKAIESISIYASERKELFYIVAFAVATPAIMLSIMGSRVAGNVIAASFIASASMTLIAAASAPLALCLEFVSGGLLAFASLFCGLLLLPFGWDLFEYALFTTASSDPTPPGTWQVHQLGVITRSTINKRAQASTLAHSSHTHPDTPRVIACWIAERKGRWESHDAVCSNVGESGLADGQVELAMLDLANSPRQQLLAYKAAPKTKVRTFLACIGGVAIISVSIVGLKHQREAEIERINRANTLATAAKALLQKPTELEASTLLAIEAIRIEETSETADLLQQTLSLLPKKLFTLHHKGPVRFVAFSPDGLYVASGGNDGAVIYVSLKEPQKQRIIQYAFPITGLQFSADNHWLATSSVGGTVRILNRDDGTESSSEVGAAIKDIKFTGDSSSLGVLTETGEILFLKTRDWSVFRHVQCGRGMSALLFDGHNDFYLVRGGNVVQVFSSKGGYWLLQHDSMVNAAAFMADSHRVITGTSRGRGYVWSLPEGSTIGVGFEHEFSINAMAYERIYAGELLAVAGGSLTRLYNVELPYEFDFRTLVEAGSNAGSISIGRGGQDLVVGGTGIATVWQVWHKGEKRCLHNDTVNAVEASPKDTQVITGSSDNTAIVWETWFKEDAEMEHGDLSTHEEISTACERLTRNLTNDEWHTFIGNQPYRRTCRNIP